MARTLTTALNNQRTMTKADELAVAELLAHAERFAEAIERLLPESREKSLAWTHLEDALTRANKAVYTQGAVQP